MTARPSGRSSWLWLIAGIATTLAAAIPAHAISDTIPIAGRAWTGHARSATRHHLIHQLALWGVLYAVAVAALLRAPRRAAVTVALLGGLAITVVSIAPAAVLSNDLYRYSLDGKAQAAGIDPYRYAPDAPQLDRLHDDWLWPSQAGCAARGMPPGCTLINRKDVHTIYPPVAQLYFLGAHEVLPFRTRDRGYEVLGLVLAAVVAALLMRLLALRRRDMRLIALWTLCPAVALEAVQNAHVDILGAMAVICALLVAGRRLLLVAAFIGLAGLVKLYPLVLFPAVIARRRVMAAIVIAAMFVVAYLPHVIAVGGAVTGYLHGYLHQEGYGSGNRFVLLRLVGLSGRPASVVAAVLLIALVVAALTGRLGPPDRAAVVMFGAVLFVATPGSPWYDLLLVALVAATGAWQWLGVIAGDYVGYLTTLLGGRSTALLLAVYVPALVLAVVVTLRQRQEAEGQGNGADSVGAA